MAGNEWYETHKKNVAAALKKGKGADKEDAVPVALVKAKDGVHLLCAGIAKPKMVADAKKAGAKVISDGSLFADGDGATFEVSEGDAGVKVKFAAAAAEVLGSPMTVTVVKAAAPTPQTAPGGGQPSGDVPTPPPPQTSGQVPTPPPPPGGKVPPPPPPPQGGKVPPPPPPPGGKVPPPPPPQGGKVPPAPPPKGSDEATFTTRLKTLMPDLQKAMADPKAGQDIKLKVSEANVFARKKDFANANDLLTEAEKMAKATAGNIPTPPPPPGAKDEAAFTSRLKTLMPDLQKAMADPKAGADIKLKVSEANVFARKKDFAKANALLTEAEKLVKPSESEDDVPTPPPSGKVPPPPPPPKSKEKPRGEKEEEAPEKEEEVAETETEAGEEEQVETKDVEDAEKELEVDDNEPEPEAEESEGEDPDGLANKTIDVSKLSAADLKAAMVSLRIVGKKFIDRLPKKAKEELAEIKQMDKVGHNLVKSMKHLISKLKKNKQEKASTYAEMAHKAFGELEGLATQLDESMNANAYEEGKKGRELKKDYRKAMAWYTNGGGRGGLQSCLGRVKETLQIE